MIVRSAIRGTASVVARWSLAMLSVAGAAIGCSAGEIGGSSHPDPIPGTGGTTVTPPAPADFVAEQGGLRRLTIPQLKNSIADLFGNNMSPSTQFESDTPLSGFASIGAARVQLSATFVEQLEAAALEVAHKAFSDTATRAALVGCSPTAATDDACTTAFIRKFGRRAWRRTLTEDEVTRYVAVANGAQTTLMNFFQGLEYGVAGLLQSPFFIYRVELGADNAGNAKNIPFDDYQMATRLSFYLWNTTPDDQLLDAAEAHKLTQGGGMASQAQRLLASPRAAAAMQTFFTEMYRLADTDKLPQLPTIFPQLTPTLGAAMRDETLKFLNDLAFVKKGDFRDIFDSRSTFVNAEMAKLYGLPAGTASGTTSMPVMLPDSGLRAGLLGQASFLAINSQPNRSSPTRRGKFIREMMLCTQVASPPDKVPEFPETAPGTTRERLTMHRTEVSCAGCHAAMDPIGLGLENFDGIGVMRTTENGRPIDASGDLDGVTFSGPRELGTALRNHPQTAPCIAANMYRYAVGHVETPGEDPAIKALDTAFSTNGFKFQSLIEGVIASPGFSLVAKPQ